MGFEVDEPESRSAKAGIRGSKDALRVDGFSSDREGADRIVDSKIAATMIQTFQSIFSNPALSEAAGLEQLIELFNQILVYSGAPKDFRLRIQLPKNQPESPEEAQKAQEEQAAQVQQQLAQMATQVVDGKIMQLGEELRTNLVEPMQAQAQQTTQALEQLAMRQDKQAEAVMRLFKIIDIAQQQNAGSPNQVYTGGGNPADQQMAPAAGMPSPETMPFG
jgi:hypothetical protein